MQYTANPPAPGTPATASTSLYREMRFRRCAAVGHFEPTVAGNQTDDVMANARDHSTVGKETRWLGDNNREKSRGYDSMS